MAIKYKEIARKEEPWGIDVSVSFFDEETGAILQEATFNFSTEAVRTSEFEERMGRFISRMGIEMPNLSTTGCAGAGGSCNKDCTHAHKYTLEQIGEKTFIDLKEGPRGGVLLVGEVERILREKGLLLPGEKWGEFAIRKEIKNG